MQFFKFKITEEVAKRLLYLISFCTLCMKLIFFEKYNFKKSRPPVFLGQNQTLWNSPKQANPTVGKWINVIVQVFCTADLRHTVLFCRMLGFEPMSGARHTNRSATLPPDPKWTDVQSLLTICWLSYIVYCSVQCVHWSGLLPKRQPDKQRKIPESVFPLVNQISKRILI